MRFDGTSDIVNPRRRGYKDEVDDVLSFRDGLPKDQNSVASGASPLRLLLIIAMFFLAYNCRVSWRSYIHNGDTAQSQQLGTKRVAGSFSQKPAFAPQTVI